MELVERFCPVCGKAFFRKKYNHVFCSINCRRKHGKEMYIYGSAEDIDIEIKNIATDKRVVKLVKFLKQFGISVSEEEMRTLNGCPDNTLEAFRSNKIMSMQ